MSDPAPSEQPVAQPVEAAVPVTASPVQEPAPAEAQQNSSPMTGSESPVPTPVVGAAPAPTEPVVESVPEAQAELATEEKPADEPPTAASAPTPQPPLPGVGVFEEHGKPAQAVQPKAKRATYVDADGSRHPVEVVAERKDGSVDIMLPATIGGYRRDAVRRRESNEQTGDYIE